jgi:hypothetical protein
MSQTKGEGNTSDEMLHACTRTGPFVGSLSNLSLIYAPEQADGIKRSPQQQSRPNGNANSNRMLPY